MGEKKRALFLFFLAFFLLNQNPFAASLDELVEHEGDVGEDEAADVEAEEFGGVAGGELETDVCWG